MPDATALRVQRKPRVIEASTSRIVAQANSPPPTHKEAAATTVKYSWSCPVPSPARRTDDISTKSSGIFNFAQGSDSTVAALIRQHYRKIPLRYLLLPAVCVVIASVAVEHLIFIRSSIGFLR